MHGFVRVHVHVLMSVSLCLCQFGCISASEAGAVALPVHMFVDTRTSRWRSGTMKHKAIPYSLSTVKNKEEKG